MCLQVGQLAKKLGILPNGAASPTATAAAAGAAAAAAASPAAARQASPNKAKAKAAAAGSPPANGGSELKRSAPPTPSQGPGSEANKKPRLTRAAGMPHAARLAGERERERERERESSLLPGSG